MVTLPRRWGRFPPQLIIKLRKTHPWPGRIPPVTDTKMIVAWNSLMISGLARAAAVFQRDDYLALATTAAGFILEQQWDDGRLHRVNYDGKIAVLAQSEDYALLIKALLDIHQACQSLAPRDGERWLESALKLQAEFDEFLWAVEGGGYFNTGVEAANNLLIRERSWLDNATPAANGVAIANLIRLSVITEQTPYLEQAEQALQSFGQVMDTSTQACPSLFVALDWYFHHTSIRTSKDQLEFLTSTYLPAAVSRISQDLPPNSVGLVCQGQSCLEPASTEGRCWRNKSLKALVGRMVSILTGGPYRGFTSFFRGDVNVLDNIG